MKVKVLLDKNIKMPTKAHSTDAGYVGSIVVKAYNNHDLAKVFNAGDKLTQIVILPLPEVELVEAYSLEDTERGSNGFGSSGV